MVEEDIGGGTKVTTKLVKPEPIKVEDKKEKVELKEQTDSEFIYEKLEGLMPIVTKAISTGNSNSVHKYIDELLKIYKKKLFMNEDEVDDIFDIMDKLFGMDISRADSGTYKSSDSRAKFERIIGTDNVYYTFEFRTLEKDDIDIRPTEDKIILTTIEDDGEKERTIDLPYFIIPDETKVTFVNGILDITVSIDKKRNKQIDIEG